MKFELLHLVKSLVKIFSVKVAKNKHRIHTVNNVFTNMASSVRAMLDM